MLHTSVSVTMASAATREITNTGRAAGWSARSTNGSRAMIFGALSNSSAVHHGAGAGDGEGRNEAEIAFRCR